MFSTGSIVTVDHLFVHPAAPFDVTGDTGNERVCSRAGNADPTVCTTVQYVQCMCMLPTLSTANQNINIASLAQVGAHARTLLPVLRLTRLSA